MMCAHQKGMQMAVASKSKADNSIINPTGGRAAVSYGGEGMMNFIQCTS